MSTHTKTQFYTAVSSLGLASSIFLFPFQIPLFGFSGVGLNFFFMLPLVCLVHKLPIVVFRRLLLLIASIFALTIAAFLLGRFSVSSIGLFIALSLYLCAASVALHFCLKENFLKLRKTIFIFLMVQNSIHVLEFLKWYSPNSGWERSHYLFDFNVVTGFFSEASHVGFSLTPLVFLWFNKSSLDRKIALLAALSVSVSFSSTAIAIFIMVGIACWIRSSNASTRIRGVFWGGLILTVFVPLAPSMALTATGDRIIALSQILAGNAGGHLNLSSLIYMNGASMALDGIMDVVGAGIGQMHIYYPGAPYSFFIETINSGESLNKNDGGSSVFKLAAEFGMFGILFVWRYLIFVFKIVGGSYSYILTIFSLYFLTNIIRGAGYFDGPMVISIALFLYAPFLFKKHNLGHRYTTENSGVNI